MGNYSTYEVCVSRKAFRVNFFSNLACFYKIIITYMRAKAQTGIERESHRNHVKM